MSGVFLSYAREDLPFVRRLRDALSAAGRDPAWDQDHAVVPFSSPYQSEIDTAIAGSEKFVFVISPDSLDSGPCAAELAEAAESNKQIIPLLRRPARDGQTVATAVAERNWIFFDDDARFDASLAELIQTLDTDLDWVKVHTRLLVRAREWTDGSDRSRLLRGRDLRDAESWLAKGDAHPQAPPTGSQRAFIAASRRTADRIAWLQRSVLAVGLVIAVVLASLALVSRYQAIHQRNAAIYNQTLAEALRFGSSDTPLAAQLNLAAYRMQPSQGLASTLLSTDNAPLSRSLAGDSGPVTSVAFSPSGQTLATAVDGTVRLWDVATSPMRGHSAGLCAAASDRSIRWLSAATGTRSPAAASTGRFRCGMSLIPRTRCCSPRARPASPRWPSARTGPFSRPAITGRSGCGMSPTPHAPGRSARC